MRATAPSFRLEMLQVARVAPKALGESSELVRQFVLSKLSAGGFSDREGRPDLYYSVFGIEALLALQADIPREQIRTWLRKFGDGAGLDFVHLCSLARCGGDIGGDVFSESDAIQIARRIDAFRTSDGGFHGTPGKLRGSAYGCLLAWGAYADLGLAMPDVEALSACVASLQTADGGYANEPGLPFGSTTATAAAVTLCRHLQKPLSGDVATWLRKQVHRSGGFLAAPGAPLPDLLSTAVALHALDALEADLNSIKEGCLDFVDSLWSAEGGFHGHWADDDLDCEYTYYGLLALGHLTL
jgi:prenyltransferase beta subunit